MSDVARHGATQHDEVRHTLTVRQVETLFAKAGVQRSHRHVLRLCKSGMLDAVKIAGGPTGEEWYIAPASVPKAIGDLQQIDALRERRGTPEPATSHHVAPEIPLNMEHDTARHSALQPDVSVPENGDDRGVSERATARPTATEEGKSSHYVAADLDIYQHPYVKRLEGQVEKLEGKLEAQVRRTEEIQQRAQDKLVELQRMTTIGQSKTLADFMLQAKNWMVGAEVESSDAPEQEGKSTL